MVSALIVEDDRCLARLLSRSLEPLCGAVETAASADEAIGWLRASEPMLLVLDLELEPKPASGGHAAPAGLAVLAAARAAGLLCPVLVLSAAADTGMRVRCLELGADDCMQKPFALSELRARCAVLLARWKQLRGAMSVQDMAAVRGASRLSAGELTLDRLHRAAWLGGVQLRLTAREWQLLERLLLAAGCVVPREELREPAAPGRTPEANAVDVHVAALRRKLAEAAREGHAAPRIETVRGQGYRLVAEGIFGSRGSSAVPEHGLFRQPPP